jgi:hypothetical protein
VSVCGCLALVWFVHQGDTRPGYAGHMKPLRIAGVILTAGGGVGLVVAITAMTRIGSCGNGYDAPCPAGIANDFYLMAGAVVAIAAGSVMTWGAGLLVAILAAGVTAVVYAATVPAHMRTGEYVIAGICFGVPALLLALCIPAFRRDHAKRRRAQEHIASDGQFRQAATVVAGTVTALRDTGITINGNPQAVVTISYTRADGGLAQAETVQVLPRLEIPRPGDPATVWYDPVSGKALASLGAPDAHTAPADTPAI